MRQFIIFIGVLFLAGCISSHNSIKREKRRAFDPAEYAYVKINGSSTIKGEVLIPQRDGSLDPCSGCEVTLNPATSYSEEFYIKTVQNGIPIEEPDLRVFKYIKKTATNDSGRFEFKNIASGKYFIYAPVKYEIPDTEGGYNKIDTYLYESVFIRKGEEKSVRLKRE